MSRSFRPDFRRDVHCVFGLPFDAVTEEEAVRRLREAARTGQRLFLSTPNLNFAAGCVDDMDFRLSVVDSDLSTADGAPIVWLARLMGVPIPERVTGAGAFDRLAESPGHRVAVYFFGGPEGTAQRAVQKLNEPAKPGAYAVGCSSPGFRPLEAIGGAAFTDPINATSAEFVVVALGARKGQAWIEQNWPALKAPVISHLGAVVNFVAGTVMRAPVWLQRSGMEWLWRIREEPALWRRYWNDGWRFLHFIAAGALPLALFNRAAQRPGAGRLDVETIIDAAGLRLKLSGEAHNGPALDPLRAALEQAAAGDRHVQLDMESVRRIGSGFIALVQLMDAWQRSRGGPPVLDRVPDRLARVMRWSGAGYLLSTAG
ncbi:MAG: WecB/TagA/CpsF family glycosyltransferase [Rubrivivax sp.]|nr:WecB/TagA/CpsF family glycosyltransferase [Rubrivivax sp.]